MNADQIKIDFQRDGFLIRPALFSQAEVGELKAEGQTILAQVRREKLAEGLAPERIFTGGVYVGTAARSELFRTMLADERLLEILAAIIGPNIEFLSDKIVFKDEETDFASPWHQDWPYWQGCHKISVWIALDDVSPENGALKLIPGSHQTHAVHDGQATDGHGFGNRLRPEAIDETQAVTALVAAGGAVFFHDLTLHASHPNTHRQDRWVWIPTYRDAMADDPEYGFAIAKKVVLGQGR